MTVRPQNIGPAIVPGCRHPVRPRIAESGTDGKTALIRILGIGTADGIRHHDRTGRLLDPAEFSGIKIAPAKPEITGNKIKLNAVIDLTH